MTHYPDLAPCDYFPVEHSGAFVAVGWLGRGRDYPKGRLTRREHDSLVALSQEPYAPLRTMGLHNCELSRPTFPLVPCFRALSNKDLFIPYGSQVFVAPGGILHYIEVHHYIPPEVFRRAVVECPPMGSKAYFAALGRTDWASMRRGLNPDDILEADFEYHYRWHFALGNKNGPELIRQYGLLGLQHRLDFALGDKSLSEFEREHGHLEPASESNQSPPGDASIQDQDTIPLTATKVAKVIFAFVGLLFLIAGLLPALRGQPANTSFLSDAVVFLVLALALRARRHPRPPGKGA